MNYKIIQLNSLIKKDDELFQIIRLLPIFMFFDKNTNEIDKTLLKKGMESLGGDWVLQENNNFIICKKIEDTLFEDIIPIPSEIKND